MFATEETPIERVDRVMQESSEAKGAESEQLGPTYEQLIDHLTFNSYVANRLAAPEIPAYRWAKVYGLNRMVSMEARLHELRVK